MKSHRLQIHSLVAEYLYSYHKTILERISYSFNHTVMKYNLIIVYYGSLPSHMYKHMHGLFCDIAYYRRDHACVYIRGLEGLGFLIDFPPSMVFLVEFPPLSAARIQI